MLERMPNTRNYIFEIQKKKFLGYYLKMVFMQCNQYFRNYPCARPMVLKSGHSNYRITNSSPILNFRSNKKSVVVLMSREAYSLTAV